MFAKADPFYCYL